MNEIERKKLMNQWSLSIKHIVGKFTDKVIFMLESSSGKSKI